MATIEKATEALNAAWTAASEDMYKGGGQAGPSGFNPNTEANGSGSNTTENSETVTDAEFEEVK